MPANKNMDGVKMYSIEKEDEDSLLLDEIYLEDNFKAMNFESIMDEFTSLVTE